MADAQDKLKQALIILLDDNDFDQLSVSKICKEAGVHRSTFYAYYDNQFDLLDEALEYVSQLFHTEFENLQEGMDAEKEYDSLIDSYYLKPYLTYIKNHSRLYRIFLKNQRDFRANDNIAYHIETVFTKRYYAKKIRDDRKIELMSHFYMAGLRSVIYDWVMADCEDDIDYLINIIHTIIF